MFMTKLCNFIIRTYIQLSLFIQINSFVSAHLKYPDIFTPFITWNNLGFSGVQRHNYSSDFRLSLYVVTYYEVTSLYRISLYLSEWLLIVAYRLVDCSIQFMVKQMQQPIDIKKYAATCTNQDESLIIQPIWTSWNKCCYYWWLLQRKCIVL